MSKFQHTSFSHLGQFLDCLPEEEREVVLFFRDIILKMAPLAKEKLSYNVPFYSLNKRFCYIWPSSVPWGGNSAGVALGFTMGDQIIDDFGLLKSGNRKHVKTYEVGSIKDIDVFAVEVYLEQAINLVSTKNSSQN